MNKIQHTIKIAGLIAKHICNRNTLEEKEELDSWKNESEGNKQVYNKIINWDNFQKRNEVWKSFDAEQAWGQFSRRVNKNKPNLYIKQIAKYAAAITIPFILGGTVFYSLHIKQSNDIKKEVATINPGTQSATIILDDGESINLEKGKLNQLIEKDGSLITNQKGQLSYPEAKASEQKTQLENTLIVPRGGEYTLVLSDGSRVFLNSVSKLTYPVAFNKDKREVTLEGEAYFEVEKEKNRPFLVNIDGVTIEVLGTSFNVKAYSEEDNIYTTLVEGKVKLNTAGNSNECILVPDQQAVIKRNSNNVQVREVDVQQFIGWKNGIYSFADESIEDIIKTLSRWYDFKYEFTNESLKSIHFEGGLNKYENIYPILDIMESTGKLKYRVDGEKIIFMKK